MEDTRAPQVAHVADRLFELGRLKRAGQVPVGLQSPTVGRTEHRAEVRQPQSRGGTAADAPYVLLWSGECLEDPLEVVRVFGQVVRPELRVVHARVLQPHV